MCSPISVYLKAKEAAQIHQTLFLLLKVGSGHKSYLHHLLHINLLCRANLEYSTLKKKLASDFAVEKATAKKVEVEVASLERSVNQMVR